MEKIRKSQFLWLFLGLILLFIFGFGGNGWSEQVDEPCTIMHPDWETLLEWNRDYESAPKAQMDLTLSIPLRGSLSLLSHLNYVPSDRNQGWCGNCWAWAGTGVMEIALDVEESVFNRLSVQYNNSCGGTGGNYGCCGGNVTKLVDFYTTTNQAVPWSNTNASWQDGAYAQRCNGGTGVTNVPCGSISTSPNYTIDYLTEQTIITHGVGQATAIANIKNILHQGKAIYFSFRLANDMDWNNFRDTFWNGQGETAIWNPDFSCGHTWITGEGGGHAVLCVGYNDDDPNNRYWIMVNSWGTASGGRPNGIFRLDMDMNYDCTLVYGSSSIYSFNWYTLDIDYTVTDSCECDLNHDGECNILDWPFFIEDWGRTDCPILSMTDVVEKVAPNNNESGNPGEEPVADTPVFRRWKVEEEGIDNSRSAPTPPIKTGRSVPGGDVGDAIEKAKAAAPIWQRLDQLDLSDKKNALLQLEVDSDLDTDTLNEVKNVETLWNSEKFAEAIESLQAIEAGGLAVAAGISWKTPLTVDNIEWYPSDVRIATRQNVNKTHLDFDAQTGNLFAVLRYEDTSSGYYYWSVNISTNDGQTWQETYEWWATSEIPDVSAAVVDDYLFIGYIPNVPIDEARIRRCTVSNGLIDNVYDWKTVFDKNVDIKEIALCSNADDYDNRIYYWAILNDYRLIYYWDDSNAVSWTEQNTGVIDAWGGLDATWNQDHPSGYYLQASYIGYIIKAAEVINPVCIVRHATGVWDEIQLTGYTGVHPITSVTAYNDTLICAYEHEFINGIGIRYSTSYNGGDSWSAGWWDPEGGHNFYNPDVTARGGQGSAIVYDDEAGAFDPVWFRYRDHYSSGAWDAEVAQINEKDGATAWPNRIEWVPPLPGNSYAYGAIYISWDPDPGTPYFDRSDGGEADVCECDLNGDGNCNILDWPFFIEDWGRTDCPIPE